MFKYLTAHCSFIHWDPAPWHLTHVRAELLDGCLDAVDFLCEPAVQSPLRHCLSVQSLQTAGDSLEQGLVALSGHTNTRAAGKRASWTSQYWKRSSEYVKVLPNYDVSKYISELTWGNKKVIQLQKKKHSYLHPNFQNLVKLVSRLMRYMKLPQQVVRCYPLGAVQMCF